MATVDECAAALSKLSTQLSSNAGKGSSLDRTISCSVTDLDVVFSGRLVDGRIEQMSTSPSDKAQVRLTTSSDDLVALADGTLPFSQAWSAGRLKVDASVFDLLKLRSLF